MAINNYVILSNTGAIGGGKKLDVLLATWREPRRSISARATLTDKTYAVIGAGRTPWAFRLQVLHTPRTGYFSKAELEAYLDVTTAATALWKFQDIYGTVWDAQPVGTVELVPALAPVFEGSDAWFEADMTIRRRL